MRSAHESIALYMKMSDLLEQNNYEINLDLANGTTAHVKILKMTSQVNELGFTGTVVTFTTNINVTTNYDFNDIRDVS
jgi:hypothetical protein